MLRLYNNLCAKFSLPIYKNRFSTVSEVLSNGRESFEALSVYQQCNVIIQILYILQNNVLTGDLQNIGGSKKSGVVVLDSKIKENYKYKSFKIINQSVTGLYESEIDLLKL